ncbi:MULTISPECIES: hypothetical protein [Pontibacillus]|uniref:Multi-TM2 domain-containing protein n=1 Tax=Pontibacillus chungwhensis TaxID=265426 RepID=A0ABY8V0S5_9BACI|nr:MULTISPECIES: hypothetical protein [Pontibacillus]MCD5325468.1 hypothetical protein [Pontibacillus sp. HN14]WIF98581.1 hypothetical protein QNI29_02615 [Pontibacillus chungwhensis]
MNKSIILAFFLSFVPGFGQLYLGRKLKGLMFGGLFFSLLVLTAGAAVMTGDPLFLVPFSLACLVWLANMVDMIFAMRRLEKGEKESHKTGYETSATQPESQERLGTILLSFIPGVGHFYLGLNQRGLTFLTGFLGVGTMIFFVTAITSTGGFLIFLLALPIIWIYGLFDVIQLLNQKDNGEPLEDRTILEDFDRHRDSGKKSRVIATLLGIFPGAGHMYLGLQRRGLQLMAAFLLSIYILDVLNLSIFLFLIPIIWFFSFFDTLQLASRYEDEAIEDVPVIKYFINHQRWIGIVLILLGFFYMLDDVLMPVLADEIRETFQVNLYYYYERYFQMIIVCLLFIGGGIKLLLGSKVKNEEVGK